MNTTATAPDLMTKIIRGRRWMIAGLVVSIMGTRIVEGGSNGAVATEILPVAWIALLVTIGQGLSFLSPLIAKFFYNKNPANLLVLSDLVEAVISVLALIALVSFPDLTVPIVIVYFIMASFFPVATDIIEELYAQQLAQLDEEHALKFNSAIYSILAFVGIVIGVPLGTTLAGFSIEFVVLLNAGLSLLGTLLRLVSSRIVSVNSLAQQDHDDFGALGQTMSLGEFLTGLWKAGPASPAISFLTQIGGSVAGLYFYLWIAREAQLDPNLALAMVIGSFGLGATLGPLIVPQVRKFWDPITFLRINYLATILVVVLALVLVYVPWGQIHWVASLLLVFLMGTTARVRAVLIATLRQTTFRGKKFSSIMSWTFSLVALADIIGNWLAVGLQVVASPQYGLFIMLICVLVCACSVLRPKGRQPEPGAGPNEQQEGLQAVHGSSAK